MFKRQIKKKSILLLTGFVLAYSSSIDPCFPQVSSSAGCIESCDLPKYDDCADKIFIQIYDPHFCGYNPTEDSWVNYTFACQACNNPDVVGLIDSKCHCSFTGCKQSETCDLNTGQCITIIEQQQTCSNNPPNKVDCKRRPTKQECFDIQYIRAPDLIYCGIDKYGNRQGFARGCQACINRQIVSYYQAPCEQVPQIFCKDYEFCTIQGYCLDKCATMRCSPGYQCKMGQCVIIKQNNLCVRDSDCKSGYFCSSNTCVDKCLVTLCIQGSFCVNGRCI